MNILIRAWKYSNTTLKWMFNKYTPPNLTPPFILLRHMCLAHGSHVQLWWQILTGRQSHFFFKAPRKSGWLNASACSKTTGLGAQLSVWKVFFSSVSELFSLNWISAHLPEAWRYYSHRNSVVENLRDLTQVIYVPDKVQINKNIFLLTNFSIPQSSYGDVINPHTGQGFKAGLKRQDNCFLTIVQGLWGIPEGDIWGHPGLGWRASWQLWIHNASLNTTGDFRTEKLIL